MTHDLNRFRDLIVSTPDIAPDHPGLLIERDGRLACHYAPFEHVNPQARVVLVGITPGAQQARNALDTLGNALRGGATDEDALAEAKRSASFCGQTRVNLVALLDQVGLHRVLGVSTCAELFGARSDLVHCTPVLRNPIFRGGGNYRGQPPVERVPMLGRMVERWFAEELDQLHDAIWVPLGHEPTAVLRSFVANGRLCADNLWDGLPHPSPANAERIAYFLGVKPREALSNKVDPDQLDERLAKFRAKLGGRLTRNAPVSSMGRSRTVSSTKVRVPAGPRAKVSVARSKRGPSCATERAEALIVDRFERLEAGTSKVAGFQTLRGRHLAIQRDVQCIRVWTEALEPPHEFAPREHYPAGRARHSNLRNQAPRLGPDHAAYKWCLEDTAQLEALIGWYATA